MRYIQSFSTSGAVQEAIENQELGRPYVAYVQDGQYIDWDTRKKNDGKVVAYYKSNTIGAICTSSADTFTSAELEDGTPVSLGENLRSYFSKPGEVIKVYYTLKDENILGDSAFQSNRAIKVEIPDNVVMSGSKLFLHSLVSAVNITTATTVLPGYCFRSCSNFKQQMVIPENIQKTGEESLAYSGFLSIVFPSGLREIGKNTLWKSEQLRWIEFKGTTPPKLETNFSDPLGDTSLTFPIYVPDEAVAAYKAAPTWANYANRVKGISGIPEG